MLGWRCWLAVACVALVGGCGGVSAKQVATARDAVYRAEFEVLWSAARQELFDRYGLRSDKPDRGVMDSPWVLFDEAGAKKAVTVNLGKARERLITVRFVVRVLAIDSNGDGGWRIEVDAVAAEYQPGLLPAPSEGADKPPWLQPRIDALSVAIYERLEGYAVTSDH